MSVKTYLLENDNFMWAGLEDFCKSFDPNYQIIRTEKRDYIPTDDYIFVGMIAQPSVERLIVASAFESKMFIPRKDGATWQVEHYMRLIEGAFKVREILGLGKLYVDINYHGHDLIKDIKDERWGWDFSASIKRFVRQNPDNLIVNVYADYQLQYRLTEENMYD